MKKTIYALIIGINNYPKNKLRGCINDALDVRDFLDDLKRDNDSIEAIHCKYLLSPLENDIKYLEAAGLSEGSYDAPTRQNVIDGFGHFKNAKPENGDSCLLYYIGHGSFQIAPKPFWHHKSARQFETIVCEDSRSHGGKDLLDKELGYLIWNVVKEKKDLHFLAIMDSCHSGDNTRSNNSNIKARQDTPNRNSSHLEKLIGFKASGDLDKNNKDNFYFYSDAEKEKMDTRKGRHVQIAAALENQSAKELSIDGRQRGIFTYSLFKTLRNGGTQLSYDELVLRISDYIKNHVKDQDATSSSEKSSDMDLKFLGEKKGYQSPKEEFGVVYSEKGSRKEWKLLAGKINGIVPSIEGVRSLVRIIDRNKNDRIVEIKRVTDNYAILDEAPFNDIDKETILKATIESMPRPKIRIGYAPGLSDESKARIEKQYKIDNPDYFEMDSENCSYEIHEAKEFYFITELGKSVPLFQRQSDLTSFFTGIEKIGKWDFVLNLGENNNSLLKRDDIDVEVLIYEGKELSLDLLGEYPTPTRTLKNPKEINLQYIEVESPDGTKELQIPGVVIKVSSPKNKISYQAFTMSNEFGITNLYARSETIEPGGEGEYLSIEYEDYGRSSSIFYSIEEVYPQEGIFEVRDYLKFFISLQPININYKQDSLPIDSVHFGNERGNKIKFKKTLDNWMAFNIPVNIKHPMPSKLVEQEVKPGINKIMTDIELVVPEGFSAKVTLASEKNIKEALENIKQHKRSLNDMDDRDINTSLLPPSYIWGNCASDSYVMTKRGASSTGDSNLSVLEMEVLKGADAINDEEQLVLKTAVELQETESVIPFAFDEETGLYLPFGYTNENGDIIINHLPKPTSGKIYNEGAINTRSLGRSIKLFLKKIIWTPNDLNQLKKVVQINGEIQSVKLGKGELAAESTGEIALLIHGIIGNTEAPVNSMFHHKTELHKKFGTILTYDYENLGTGIEEIAKVLKNKLEDAGLFEAKDKKLTIIAHSMGGLVSRYFIENKELDGAKVVRKIIQLGTPNGGSEISDVRKFLTTALAWGMNGLAPIKPYMPAISFLTKWVGSRLFKTLNQMSPKGEFIKELAKDSKVGEIPYFIIAGDTSRIDSGYMENDPFWIQLKKAIKNKGTYTVLDKFVFPSKNDMAVTIKSMQTIPGFEPDNISEIAGDHITYFENEDALILLEKYINV